MPQMSPLNWVSLFISFTIIFMLINSMNYFFINYNFKINKENIKLSKINWKW
nr:ATP synthase F0 subunit 8 [Tillus discoidalis]WIL79903.1 ATP synthase F0 subunit 8 [Opilo sinensis]